MEQLAARWAHNPKVAGSSPAPATKHGSRLLGPFFVFINGNNYFCNMKLIEMNIDRIAALCQKYKVAKLWVFGSILTPRFNKNSDIDFSVNFDSETIDSQGLDWADIFFDFMHELESLMGRPIDLVCDDAVTNKIFRKELDSTKQLIYGR